MNTGHVWKFLDDGTDQGTAWREVGFDDSGWASGPSSLGYGAEGEGRGPRSDMARMRTTGTGTTYFRTTVEIPDPAVFVHFLLRIKYDDGAAVYVNGVEVVAGEPGRGCGVE